MILKLESGGLRDRSRKWRNVVNVAGVISSALQAVLKRENTILQQIWSIAKVAEPVPRYVQQRQLS
jgi:hypothetical protein